MVALPGVAILILALGGCAKAPVGPVAITVFHTNDMHGGFTERPATWREGNPPVGGFSNLSAAVEGERAKGGRFLLLDAGDFMTGNPVCDYEIEGAKGGGMIEFMNLLDYDVVALGNHEFDHGLDNLDALMRVADFPIISANTYRPEGGLTAPARYQILDVDGLRVGVIGLMTESLYGVASPTALAGTEVTSAAEAANELIKEIDPKTDLIILLSHIGANGDRRLARQVRNADIIVGGHSHTRIRDEEIVNGIRIAHAGSNLTMVGRLDLIVQGDTLLSYENQLIDLWPREGGKPDVVTMESEFAARIEADFGKVIGQLTTDWERASRDESNLGNWLADCLREFGGGDFAVVNSGGIRKDLLAGPITKMDIVEILPFSNVVTTFTCSGEELLTLIKENALAMAVGSHGMLQVSGIRYTFSESGGVISIKSATVGGEPIDPAATYTGVSIDYVSHGNADRFFGFDPAEKEMWGDLLSDVIMRAVEEQGTIESSIDGRVTIVSGRSAGRDAGN